MSPGFHWKWGIRHPLRSARESYGWARNESGHGRLLSIILIPYNWLAFASGR